MKITSSLLNDDDFKFVKQSLIDVSNIDGEQDFRVKVLEYINDSSDEDDLAFFYDMLEFVRFLHPNEDAVAFTTPDKRIWMNCPNGGNVGKNIRHWDFIYDHECLHQLWDTWEVGKKIEEKHGKEKFNHDLLNYASDCVINDYLNAILKKPMPNDLVTPQYIKEKFGVDYDRKVDTQYTLYMKMLEVIEKIKKDPQFQKSQKEFNGKIKPKSVQKSNGGNPPVPPIPQEKHSEDYIKGWTDAIQDVLDKKVDPTNYKPKKTNKDYDKGYDDAIDNIKQGIENGLTMSGGGSNSGDNGSDLPNIPWDLDDDQKSQGGNSDNSDKNDKENKSEDKSNESAEDAADRAKKAADKAQKEADKAAANGDKEAEEKQEAADKAKAEADKAKEAADKSKEAEKAGDKKEAEAQTKKAQEAADKAEEEAGVKEGDSDDKSSQQKKQKGKPGDGHDEVIETEKDIKEITKKAEKRIEEYKNKISGHFGEFIKKCKSAAQLEDQGLATGVQKGSKGAAWNQKMNSYIMSYVKNKVFKQKRLYKRTYKRVKRGSGFVETGKPIEKGKIIRDEKLSINVAFYIDRSGSMSGSIEQVFDACYIIFESLKKQFAREKVVSGVSAKIFAFDTSIQEIKFGKKCNAGGGTMSFDSLINCVKDRTNNYLINIIITDGEFNVDKNKTKDFIKHIEGMLLFITNSEQYDVKDLAQELKLKLFYILADSNFTIKK